MNKYVRCRECDSAWFLDAGMRIIKTKHNGREFATFDCPACSSRSESYLFKWGKERQRDSKMAAAGDSL